MREAREVIDELLPFFRSESEERLNSISSALAALDDAGSDAKRGELIESLLRELHSLKGGARAVNLSSVEAVSHSFETLLVRIQNRELTWNTEVAEACQKTVEGLGELLSEDDKADEERIRSEVVSVLDSLEGTSLATEKPTSTPVAPGGVAEEEITDEERQLLGKLLPVFRSEAEERLASIAGALEELRGDSIAQTRQEELFESVMRDAHSIKGGARTMKLAHASAVCERFEFAAAKLMRKEIEPYPELYDLFERASDLVQTLLTSPESLSAGQINRMIEELDSADHRSRPTPAVETPPVDAEVPPAARRPGPEVPVEVAKSMGALRADQTVRVATEKLDNVLRQSQEMLIARLAMRQRSAEVADLVGLIGEWQTEWSRVDTDVYRLQSWVEKNDEESDTSGMYSLAANAVRFLEWNQKRMRLMHTHARQLSRRLFDDTQDFGVLVETLVDETKRALMLPLSTLFNGLPRMVRAVARSQKKAVDFEVSGDDVEVDKRILDEMRDPLMHLLRNCVDHGLEPTEEREKEGKPKRGRITIDVSQSAADQVEMTVRDDGRGIDTDRVRRAAVRNGVLTESQARVITREEVLQLIFRSGVSTSERVSNISGRGLGMAICREGVERLGGTIRIAGELGRGASFHISLPLALATYRVLLLEAGQQTLALPIANVERVVRLTPSSIEEIDGKEMIRVTGQSVPLQQLDRFLGLEWHRSGGGSGMFAAVVRSGNRRAAFAVQRVLDEQEVLFKDLGSYLVHVPNVSGATVLGTGRVVPILNVPEMVDAAYADNVIAARAPLADTIEEPEEERRRSILVVEDSITSRMLLKEILESSGYLVTTAINGAEAVNTLEQEEFDLVVSDVEMPRMNGFELVAHLRASERWSELPLILVTGLERDEERQRGLSAGANEYIVKGSFEQSNLLEAIRRLCGQS